MSAFANNSYSFLAGLGIAVLLVVGWVLIYPVIMFLLGWLQGAILAVVFNVVVSGSGGLSVHVEETNMDGNGTYKK
ncbi:MAG: hypothetical protein U0491_01930 [Candidatus Saccharimonadales bacterium]